MEPGAVAAATTAATTADTDSRTATFDAWLEISAAAYQANLAFFRRLTGPGVELSAVLKANAYGHGRREVAALARDSRAAERADSFCVFSLDEALALRRDGHDCPILVLGPVVPPRLDEAVGADLRLALFDAEAVPALRAASRRVGRPARVHLKVETGTHRFGLDGAELGATLAALRSAPEVVVEGAYTHFANIEDTTDRAYATAQRRRFEHALETIAAAGFSLARRHAACTAALLAMPETAYDLARLGIGQFGLWPSKETRLSFAAARGGEPAAQLEPVLTWKTRIAQLKSLPTGAFVGYGCTWQATRPTRLAVLPVGYADGYDRRLSNQAWTLVRGCRAPVRGRVCMNLMMVDVTDVPAVAVGDEVVLLGRQGDQAIAAEQLAGLIGTIHYEVTTRIRADLPRLVV